jgi:CBS domain-containing protein
MTDPYELEDELLHMDELTHEGEKHEIRLKHFDQPVGVLEPPDAVCVETGTSVRKAIHCLSDNNVGCVMVVRNRKLVGIFTERDVLFKIAGRTLDTARSVVDDFMTPDPKCLMLSNTIREAIRIFRRHKVRHIPIVNDQQEPIAFTSVRGVIDYIVSFFSEEVINLPPHPLRVGTLEADGA